MKKTTKALIAILTLCVSGEAYAQTSVRYYVRQQIAGITSTPTITCDPLQQGYKYATQPLLIGRTTSINDSVAMCQARAAVGSCTVIQSPDSPYTYNTFFLAGATSVTPTTNGLYYAGLCHY